MKYLKKYNESFNNESTLREALEIYAEDLPFGVDIMEIAVKHVPSYKSYVVTYEHTEDNLNLFSRITSMDDSAELIQTKNFLKDTSPNSQSDKAVKQKALVKEILLDKIDVVFGRFARKYDMVYVPSRIAYIPEEGDSVDVRFELKQLTRHRVKPQNESLSEQDLVESIKIELEDCTDFEIESITPYEYKLKEKSFWNLQLLITEDFSSNSEVRKMIDKYLTNTHRFSAELVDITAEMKSAIYDTAKQINTRMFSKIAKKYDIKDLDIYVSGHNWRLNGSYTIKIFISGKI